MFVLPKHPIELTRIEGARLLILPGGHGDYLGEAVMTQRSSPCPKLTAGSVEVILDGERAGGFAAPSFD